MKEMSDVEIRTMFLNRDLVKRVKELTLTDTEYEILRAVSCGLNTSSAIAKTLHIGVNNASLRLKTLHSKGYLVRNELESATGGKEFEYASIYKV